MARPSELATARRRLFLLLAAGGVLLLLLLGLPGLAHLYTELRWFESVGRGELFTTVLWTRVLLGVAAGALMALVLEINLRVALRVTRRLPSLHLRDPGGGSMDLGALAPRVLRPVALAAAVVAGIIASRSWSLWLKLQHAASFGTSDPLFGQDVGFYVFQLPVLEAVRTFALWAVVLSLLFSAATHLARGGLVHDGRTFVAHRRTRIHLTALVALLFGLLSYDAWLDTRNLLFSTTGPVAGASYTDVHARLPALRALIGTALVGAVLAVVSATRRRLILLGAGAALYVAVALLGVRLYPALVQRFSVDPNEAVKEAPFIRRNIDASRAAYDLDDVEERDLTGSLELTKQDIEENQATIKNIRLWDHGPLLDTFAQIQEIRTYYDFASVDNDRYEIDGELRQTMLSARELSAESLPNRTWINEHFTFTHGYGLTLGPVNQATEEGLPVLYVKDIPPQSSVEGVEVTRPGIYFGELSNDHVFVKTKNREFDHPSGEENVYSSYDGRAGVRLESLWMRLALAARLGSVKLLLSDDIVPESRVLLHRDIRDRVRTIAPFLAFDGDPYMVVRDDGTLAWIQDAYTMTDRYPYAEPVRPGLNYIRNAVKVVVDAYEGSVDFYTVNGGDPILATWSRTFPGMFRPMDEMPDDLRAHLRHPENMFRIQTEMFTTYHMDDPELVYNREDQWEIPALSQAGSTQQMEPYYTVMKLPGGERPEFILMLPFTPKRKANLSAWMVARADGERLGDLRVYRFPRDRLVFGPQQIMNRINQDADISRQISLWDQRGSDAILGTLLVIPIEESLIYVSPLYLRSAGGRIPELKRVIVAYGNRITMEPTLDGALEALFRGRETLGAPVAGDAEAADEAPAAEAPVDEAPVDAEAQAEKPAATAPQEDAAGAERAAAPEARKLARQAQEAFEQADEALQRGDWAAYGRHMEEVRRLIRQVAAGDAEAAP
ncbi:MAG: UPF0182 family protein [Myxococcota bacterium]